MPIENFEKELGRLLILFLGIPILDNLRFGSAFVRNDIGEKGTDLFLIGGKLQFGQ